MRILMVAGALALSACSGGVVPPAGYVPLPSNAPPPPASVSAISGQTAPRLIAQFGQPLADVAEGNGRKLQFAGPICVLDAYLYPQRGGAAVVTYIETRQRNGGPIDPASCVAALTKRR